MKTYGLTLKTCEALIWAVRQEPGLYNWCYEGGDGEPGLCCLIGALGRHTVSSWDMKCETSGFEIDWFAPIAHRMGLGPNGEEPAKGSPGLRWLTLLKLKAIREALLDEAEQREELSRWAPAPAGAVPSLVREEA